MAKPAQPRVKNQLPKIPQPSLEQLASQEYPDPRFNAVIKTMALIEGLPPQIPRPPLEGFMMIAGESGKKESPIQFSMRVRKDIQEIISKYRLDAEIVFQILKPLEFNLRVSVLECANRVKTIQKQLQQQMRARERLQTAVADIQVPAVPLTLRNEIRDDCHSAQELLSRAWADMNKAAAIITPWARRSARTNVEERCPSSVHEIGYQLQTYIERIHPKKSGSPTPRVLSKPRISPLRITTEILFPYVPDMRGNDFDKFMASLKSSIATRTRTQTR
jgi:hypothetical protein